MGASVAEATATGIKLTDGRLVSVFLAEGWSSQGGDITDGLLRRRDEWVAHAYRTGADLRVFERAAGGSSAA
ncbi:hypothetical protein [Actinoplanes sp. NPDC026623]|uniref:hypothetical protein n=1 Tax=Actinoplanes sp. NPDC026623 TaxID=3155610 RepID=UPI0033D6D2C5